MEPKKNFSTDLHALVYDLAVERHDIRPPDFDRVEPDQVLVRASRCAGSGKTRIQIAFGFVEYFRLCNDSTPSLWYTLRSEDVALMSPEYRLYKERESAEA